uniref:Tail protein n=1 Tax=Pseudomonas phage HRDY3 TaxID=3236930 RepID=A0AB39CEG4_9VIRU
MEKQLVEIRDAYRVLSDIQNLDETNPIPIRVQNSTVRKVHTTVCALREPYNEILPLNVVWFDFNPQSVYYNTARRRVSKQPDTSAGTNHTWEVIDTMAQYDEDQYYDAEDSEILAQNDPIPPASKTQLGIAKLSVAPGNGAAPVAVGEGDKRLTDARKPLDHTHEERPATMLKTKSSYVKIGDSATPVVGATLIVGANGVAGWRQLTSTDIQK